MGGGVGTTARAAGGAVEEQEQREASGKSTGRGRVSGAEQAKRGQMQGLLGWLVHKPRRAASGKDGRSRPIISAVTQHLSGSTTSGTGSSQLKPCLSASCAIFLMAASTVYVFSGHALDDECPNRGGVVDRMYLVPYSNSRNVVYTACCYHPSVYN